MQQSHRLIHSPSSSAKTSKDALIESKLPSPPVQALQNISPSTQCTGQTRPHLLCIAYPIDCAVRGSWIPRGLFSNRTLAYGVFFNKRRRLFLSLYSSDFIFLSFFSLFFCSCLCSPVAVHSRFIPISQCASLLWILLILHTKPLNSRFDRLVFFFYLFIYLFGFFLCPHELFRLQILKMDTSWSKMWTHISALVCFGWNK